MHPTLMRMAVLTVLAVGTQGTATVARSQTPADTAKRSLKPITGRAQRCKDGKIETFDCRNVEVLSYLPASIIGTGELGGDLWGWTDSATGREFVVATAANGAAFVEVTDPVNPKYLGSLPMAEVATSGLSVKVYKNHAFLAPGAGGMQIFDLTQLRNVTTAPRVFQATASYNDIQGTHTLAVDPETGFLYGNGGFTCGSGLHMIDARTPAKPTFAGCYTEPATGGLGGDGFIHDTQCVVYRGPDRSYQGREICFNSSAGALGIADVTDKQHPKTISIIRYPDLGYVHQGWLTEDQRYFFLDDEMDEYPGSGYRDLAIGLGLLKKPSDTTATHTRTIVFDMNDLDDPVVLTNYYATTTATDHNLYIRGRYMYQGNYEAGLRIVDVADPKHPKEVGYLSNIGSAPGTYPFFKDGVVAVPTSIGVFLVRLLKP